MFHKGLYMLLGAVLVVVGGLFSESFLPKAVSQWSNSSVEETILDRVICRQLVVVDSVTDVRGEFKGTLVSPTKVAIHHPRLGKAWYSYDDVHIEHPQTGQEISISFDGGVVTKGIK